MTDLQADTDASELIDKRFRVIQFFNVVFASVALAAWWFEWSPWATLAIFIALVGNIIHNNQTLLLHELVELNDQVSGRKSDLSSWVTR